MKKQLARTLKKAAATADVCPFCKQPLGPRNAKRLRQLQSARSLKRLEFAGRPRACECDKDDCKICVAYHKRRVKIEAAKANALAEGLTDPM